MLKFLARRFLLMIPVLLGVLVIVFFVSRAMPGDPVINLLGADFTQEQYEAKKTEMGLDRPLLIQLFDYIKGVTTEFNLGRSYTSGLPVSRELGGRIWVTFRLGLMSCLLTALVGIPFGIISATQQYTALDYGVTSLSIMFASLPGFWMGLMAIILFTQVLGWLPSSGLYTWKHYILPVVCNSLMATATTTRMTRSSMLEVIRQDYIGTARAKGLKEGSVIQFHAFKNAVIPIITVIGNQFSIIIGGSVVIEGVFSIAGMGTLLINSINSRDYPTIMGITVVISIFVSVVNLVVDILYCIVDPRIKAQLITGTRRRKAMRNLANGGSSN